VRRWGKGTWDEISGAVLFFSLTGAALVAFSNYCQLSYGQTLENKNSSDYLLMAVQCALALFGMALIVIIDRKWHLRLPPAAYGMMYTFLFCAVFLGEVLSFYYLIPLWDVLLHLFSGALLCVIGFVLAELMGKGQALSPLMTAVFAFSFSMALGGLWEIYEYVMDGVLHMNMQKFADARQLPLSGRAALADTMGDLMADALSGACTAVGGYYLKRRVCQKD